MVRMRPVARAAAALLAAALLLLVFSNLLGEVRVRAGRPAAIGLVAILLARMWGGAGAALGAARGRPATGLAAGALHRIFDPAHPLA